ncbi:hypothetical protein I4U23_009239 [Adineta vaga]|nr:hypothetical protein I4U23_009239 [Adineta vaga]
MNRSMISFVFLCALVLISKMAAQKDCNPVCMIYCKYGYEVDETGCKTCQCKKPSQVSTRTCRDGQAPLEDYFCGRGPNRRECPSTHYCSIAANDAYAVCCPLRG